MQSVYISIGSNIGGKIKNCKRSINELNNSDDINVVRQSLYYRTSPVDYKDQDWFINTVVEIETSLEPKDLLVKLRTIEKKIGRKTSVIRFGPRLIDLDILLYDNLKMISDELTLPHPRMHERCFVLKPLCDIDPSRIHPLLNKTMKDLLSEIEDSDQSVFEYKHN